MRFVTFMLATLAALPTLACAACGADVDLGGAAPNAPDASASVDAASESATACGDLAPPSMKATCSACDRSAPDCQPNGCFNGYFCKVAARDCTPPPSTCASDASIDSRS